jgi:hypothetical protein
MPKVQTEIPGTERESIEPVDDAVGDFLKSRDEFNRWKKKKAEAQAHLVATMQEHEEDIERDLGGALVYAFYDGEVEHEVKLETKSKVKVHSKQVTKSASDEAGEETGDDAPTEDDIDDAYADAFGDDEYGTEQAEAALG